MKTLRQQHDSLESETVKVFDELLQTINGDSISFDDEEQDSVDVYFDSSGNVVSVFVCEIFKNGDIRVQEVEDLDPHTISIWHLNSLLDKINLVEMLESKLKF